MVTTNRVLDADMKISIVSEAEVRRLVSRGDIVHTRTDVYDGDMSARWFAERDVAHDEYRFCDGRRRDAERPLDASLLDRIVSA